MFKRVQRRSIYEAILRIQEQIETYICLLISQIIVWPQVVSTSLVHQLKDYIVSLGFPESL